MNPAIECVYLKHGLMITPSFELRPCCRFDTSKYSQSFLWDQKSPMIEQYKKIYTSDLNESQKISGCHKCYSEEALGLKSMRQKVKLSNPKTDRENSCLFLEIPIGRICNLKCLSCGPQYSTRWDEDFKRLGGTFQSSPAYFDLSKIPDFTLKTIKVLKVSGGEPLLHPGLCAFFRRLLMVRPNGDVRVEFFTNGTLSPTSELLELLSSFYQTEISISVDDIKEKGHYLRPPLQWKNFNTNVKTWQEWSDQSSKILNFATTISILNCLSILDLLAWRNTLKSSKPIEFVFQFVQDPQYLSLFYLFPEAKQRLLLRLESQIQTAISDFKVEPNLLTRLQKLKLILNQNSDVFLNSSQIISELTKMDSLRGSNFKATFPLINEILFT